MSEIKLSTDFIEKELPQAPPLYVSVYLMTLALGQDSKRVAEKLHATESDVLRAWAYWMDRGVLQNREPVLPLSEKQEPQKRLLVVSERPVYSPAELTQYRKSETVQKLFFTAQQKLGKLLTHQDMSTIFSFHDWLGLPPEVIEILLSYCAADGHTGMRYIEKVAVGWADDGIDTVDKAIAYIEKRKSGIRAVMQAFGQANRAPLEKEETFIKKWLWEYKLPIPIIQKACERTVLQIGRVSFAYAESILKDWHTNGVQTEADIQKLDAAFEAKKGAQKAEQTQQVVPKQMEPQRPKQNRFINYTQSEWDFEELERLEQEHRENW